MIIHGIIHTLFSSVTLASVAIVIVATIAIIAPAPCNQGPIWPCLRTRCASRARPTRRAGRAGGPAHRRGGPPAASAAGGETRRRGRARCRSVKKVLPPEMKTSWKISFKTPNQRLESSFCRQIAGARLEGVFISQTPVARRCPPGGAPREGIVGLLGHRAVRAAMGVTLAQAKACASDQFSRYQVGSQHSHIDDCASHTSVCKKILSFVQSLCPAIQQQKLLSTP